jgi:hypothetical protein
MHKGGCKERNNQLSMDLIVKAEELELNELAKDFRKLLAEEDPKDDLKQDLYNALNPYNL